MKLTFLGTSAANAFPQPFCSCQNCAQARALGGPSLRKRSAALVNDDLLIDLGPDVLVASQAHACPLTHVRYVLQTHAHADHLDLSHLLARSPGFGVQGAPRLHFYASPGTLQRAALAFITYVSSKDLRDPAQAAALNLEIHPVEALQPFAVGGYRVIAFPANHDPATEPLLYAVQTPERALFYGTDTASLPEETWQAFHRFQLRFDLVILDHTYGPEEPGSDHLSARQVGEYAARLRLEGLLRPGGRVFATHIAHEGNPPHPQLAQYAAQHGYEAAYDGLVI
jgi:phosphoribosyl 1,2-cyclic phosphate phosphodiesterase